MDPDSYLFIVTHTPCVVLLPLTVAGVVFIVFDVILLILSAVISAAERAILSLSTVNIAELDINQSPGFKRLSVLLHKSDQLLATAQAANVFINITFVVLSTYTAFLLIPSDNLTIGLVIPVMVIIALILLIFGEIIPRMYVSGNALKILSRFSLLLYVLQIIFIPLSVLLVCSTKAAHKRVLKNQSISIDDLSNALEKTSHDITENKNILKGIVKFGSIDVHTIMTPRMDVESVDITCGLAELIIKINELGYSRIPVYDGAADKVKGILYVKDLLPYINETDNFLWQKLIRDAYFVPEHKKIDDLLNEFQEMKTHLAVIIDEYGGMVGIVTLEDILEEIVGEIADESDDDEQDFIKIDEYTYLFDGKVLLNDFFRIMKLNEKDFETVRGEADTLAGVILEIKGEIPQKGDSVDYMHLSFCVESVDNRRIKQIKITIHEPENN